MTHTTNTNIPTNTSSAEDKKTYALRRVAEAGYDYWYFADVAFAIAEGNDPDDMCQQATDTIAEALGLATLAEDEDAYENEWYRLINDIVCEMVTAQLAE